MGRQEDFERKAKQVTGDKPKLISGIAYSVFLEAAEYGYQYALQHPQWIPVEEELPKEGQVVLIHTKGGSVSTACYTDSRFDITELFQAINVTHWMEIVPPRKD